MTALRSGASPQTMTPRALRTSRRPRIAQDFNGADYRLLAIQLGLHFFVAAFHRSTTSLAMRPRGATLMRCALAHSRTSLRGRSPLVGGVIGVLSWWTDHLGRLLIGEWLEPGQHMA